MKKDNKKDEKEYSSRMKHQSTVDDTDGNYSDVIMDYAGVTTYLYLDKKCYDDSKDTQPDPNKKTEQ